jgi:hypothetical protein
VSATDENVSPLQYPAEGRQFPDITVTCARKKLLVPPIPAHWKPEDGDTSHRR